MSRRRRAIKRTVLPDPIYNSEMVSKFINVIMLSGKKSTAERAVYGALDILAERTKTEALTAFEKAMKNAKPLLEVKSRRVGGATYQVPIEIAHQRGNALAMRWILTFSRKKSGMPFSRRLANELTDAFNNTGSTVKKREDTHRMAEANRAFAHYRW
jgi:small subunit ribosomal protein S7